MVSVPHDVPVTSPPTQDDHEVNAPEDEFVVGWTDTFRETTPGEDAESHHIDAEDWRGPTIGSPASA
jgi:hypothetical protein